MRENNMEQPVKRPAVPTTVSATVLLSTSGTSTAITDPTQCLEVMVAGANTTTLCGAGSTFSDSTAKYEFRPVAVATKAFRVDGIHPAFAARFTFAVANGKVPEASRRAVFTEKTQEEKDER